MKKIVKAIVGKPPKPPKAPPVAPVQKPKPTTPNAPDPAPAPMPDYDQQKRAAMREELRRRNTGRSSTLLSDSEGKL